MSENKMGSYFLINTVPDTRLLRESFRRAQAVHAFRHRVFNNFPSIRQSRLNIRLGQAALSAHDCYLPQGFVIPVIGVRSWWN